jgi:hypothetical protein
MKETIEQHIFTFYLPMTALSLLIQLLLAGSIIWINWEVMHFTIWSDDENRSFLKRESRGNDERELNRLDSLAN